MKAERLGLLSAILASTCCVVPVALALIGLGSLGVGSLIGAYHWYLTGGALGLLLLAWAYFWREQRRLKGLGADLKNERATRASLMLASALVGVFFGLNVYTAVGASRVPAAAAAGPGEVITVPVRGMDCVACQIPIESNLKRIPGVLEAHASAAHGNAVVRVRPGTLNLEAIGSAIRAAGYTPDLSAAKRAG